MMTTFPSPSFPRKGVTIVRGRRPLDMMAASPWGGPTEESWHCNR